MIIKIFKLHPPCHASRFPFPAGIDSLAGIKKGKKKKRRYCLRNQFPVVRNFHPTYTINRCSKTAALVRSFVSHLFSNFFFFISSRPSFQLACRGDRKKKEKRKVVRLLRKKLKTIENKSFRAIFAASSSDRAKSSRRKIIIIFLVER